MSTARTRARNPDIRRDLKHVVPFNICPAMEAPRTIVLNLTSRRRYTDSVRSLRGPYPAPRSYPPRPFGIAEPGDEPAVDTLPEIGRIGLAIVRGRRRMDDRMAERQRDAQCDVCCTLDLD